MSLQALRKFSITDLASGDSWDFDQGDTIPEAAQRALPAGRLESMRNSRHVLDIGEDVAGQIAELRERVEKLEGAKKTTANRKAA